MQSRKDLSIEWFILLRPDRAEICLPKLITLLCLFLNNYSYTQDKYFALSAYER